MTESSLGARRLNALTIMDNLSPGLRECVHEFGLPIVTVCLKYGVKEPNRIRDMVREIWSGARQQGQKTGAMDTLDWLLIQNGVPLTSRALRRILEQYNLFIVPRHPTASMIAASMEAINGMGILTKSQKHKIRLTAAIKAASVDYAPPKSEEAA